MKRFLCAILTAAAVLGACAFTACAGGEKSDDKVVLSGITAEQAGTDDRYDYFVVPEPAASAKVKKIESLSFAGSLQELYGGGYPQAVVVAKSEAFTADGAVLSVLRQKLEKAGDWLAAATGADMAACVQAHMTGGAQTSLSAGALSQQAVANCSVSFESATASKSGINAFIAELNALGESSFGACADAFFDGVIGDGASGKTLSVVMPDGATALGLCAAMSEENDFDGKASFTVVDSGTIQTYVTGASPKADVCVLPVNLASKLLGSGEKYKLLGTLTHGNLYLLSKTGKEIKAANIADLKGKKVGVVMLSAVPGLTFKAVLKKAGIEYSVV